MTMKNLINTYTITVRLKDRYESETYTDWDYYEMDYEHDFLIIRKRTSHCVFD